MNIIFDTDPSPDDAVAFLAALASPETAGSGHYHRGGQRSGCADREKCTQGAGVGEAQRRSRLCGRKRAVDPKAGHRRARARPHRL